jgi:hypothetical protein
VAKPFYQRPYSAAPHACATLESGRGRVCGQVPGSRREALLRVISAATACLHFNRGRGGASAGAAECDVLWRAKRNAFRRALLDHGLTEVQVHVILGHLGAGGCQLALLGRLTGLGPRVLDRAVPLMGLQNFVTVQERYARGRSGPVLWVVPTEDGLRYAREASAGAPAAQETASGTAWGATA